MQSTLNFGDSPHTRVNILTGEKVLVSPHRSKRPWQGQVEDLPGDDRPAYDPKCYLCPTNKRADGDINPDYKESFVFVNDFSALLKDTSQQEFNEDELFIAETEKGICKVIAFTPRHDLTLPEMEQSAIKAVVDLWQKEFEELSKVEWIRYIQIFENKGAIMGCSNPHPHGQIWSQNHLPVEIRKECVQQQKYFDKYQRTLLADYIKAELKKEERIIDENDSFVSLVPFWAAWPYETMIVSKRAVQNIAGFDEKEKEDLAAILKLLTTRYDNLFKTSFLILRVCTKLQSMMETIRNGIGICISIHHCYAQQQSKNLWSDTRCSLIHSGILHLKSPLNSCGIVLLYIINLSKNDRKRNYSK